jgi:hypothetical protein
LTFLAQTFSDVLAWIYHNITLILKNLSKYSENLQSWLQIGAIFGFIVISLSCCEKNFYRFCEKLRVGPDFRGTFLNTESDAPQKQIPWSKIFIFLFVI